MFSWKPRKVPPAPHSEAEPPTEPERETHSLAADSSLLDAQVRVFGRDTAIQIVDAGAQHGQTTLQYLSAFPSCRVVALEPESGNHALAATTLAPFDERVELIRAGLSNVDGTADLRVTSHSGAHSLLEVGDMRYYDEPVTVLPAERIQTVTIDRLCQVRNIDFLDILKMDIQGGELMALQGAQRMLSRGAIRLIALEVLFQPLYRDQPTFWDLAAYLRQYEYALQGLYEPQLHARNPALLRWADAIFVAPRMAEIPQD
ncbi:FkbM family methyltransferase [Reyranella sp.]|uniref:FkbM family methyltransferase n=1 Tax=Reyranella sp. TaxID=1929291 RepID=UPI002F9534A3